MFCNRLIKIFIHPLFIGLIISAIVFCFSPPVFNKYRVKLIESNLINGKDLFYFDDLDFDNNSERIQLDLNDGNLIKILLYKGQKTLTQCNLNYQPVTGKYLYIGDFDNDHKKDLFIFTHHDDSVFLNILDILSDNPYKLKDRYIDIRGPNDNKFDLPYVQNIGLVDYDNDGIQEFVFNLNTGFSKQPRNIYVYNIRKDCLKKSPRSGASVIHPQFFNLNNDDVSEIVFGTHSTGNLDSLFPYSDQYAWLMALDKNLDFVFKPVQFDKYPCRLIVIPIATESGNRLFVLNDYFGKDSIASSLSIFNEKGELLMKRNLYDYDKGNAYILPGPEDKKNMIYFISNRQSVIELIDSNLTTVKIIKGPAFYYSIPVVSFDADGDGRKEYLFKSDKAGLYYIVRNDFSSNVAFNSKSPVDMQGFFVSIILRGDERPYIYLPFPYEGTTLEYSHNPWYIFRFVIVAGIYLAISGLIYLIFLLQRYRARLNFETTRKITELQMKAIKNQIDPHFTLNILNAIGSLFTTSEDREMADYLFGKYARLLRQSVLTSDQVEVTLEEELEFVKNYLDLEKFRLNNLFEYSIEIGEGADISLKIPRLLIHTFVENSVKYALKPMEGKGMLQISIMKLPGKYSITIIDNGPGIIATKKDPTIGTGKGLEIVDEMIQLYYNLKKVKITYSLENVMEKEVCPGARVEISILG
jgi:hypothetical protein